MRITSKGQVAIPAAICAQARLLPNTIVDFEFDGSVVRVIPAPNNARDGRGTRVVAQLRGRGDVATTTDEIRHACGHRWLSIADARPNALPDKVAGTNADTARMTCNP